MSPSLPHPNGRCLLWSWVTFILCGGMERIRGAALPSSERVWLCPDSPFCLLSWNCFPIRGLSDPIAWLIASLLQWPSSKKLVRQDEERRSILGHNYPERAEVSREGQETWKSWKQAGHGRPGATNMFLNDLKYPGQTPLKTPRPTILPNFVSSEKKNRLGRVRGMKLFPKQHREQTYQIKYIILKAKSRSFHDKVANCELGNSWR